MSVPVGQALALWGMEGAQVNLAARRENTVWRVRRDGADYALRFHRPGYRSLAELRSELQWMAMLAARGLSVPRPIPMPDGGLIGQLGKTPVSLLTWLEGRPIGALAELHDIADPAAMARDLGAAMARLHDLSDGWGLPEGFTRPDWRRDGLLGDAPLWGRFWEHPHLDAEDRAVLLRARDAANEALAGIEATADQGLIHADLLAENVMIDAGRLSLIDFDDGAWGFRDFDLATFLLKMQRHPQAGGIRAALCDGYAARRAVDPDDLDLFLLLRALTYPGWIMSRLDEPGGPDRSRRALAVALDQSNRFLERRS